MRGSLRENQICMVVGAGFVYFLAGAFWGHFFRIGTPHGDLPEGFSQWVAVIAANLLWFAVITLSVLAVGAAAWALFAAGRQTLARVQTLLEGDRMRQAGHRLLMAGGHVKRELAGWASELVARVAHGGKFRVRLRSGPQHGHS